MNDLEIRTLERDVAERQLDELADAARSLCGNLPDWTIDTARECIGHSNAGAIVHFRDKVLELLEAHDG